MEHEKDSREELLIAGVGGWGIVTIGDILARAALKKYSNVAWFPSYATMMRGGESECYVIFSQERISSPIIYRSSTVMVLGASRIGVFEDRVNSGGLMLIESTGVNDDNRVKREDVDVRYVAAIEEAKKLGSVKNTNLVILGAYVGVKNLRLRESILEEIEVRFGGKGKDKVTSACKEAFLAGIGLGK